MKKKTKRTFNFRSGLEVKVAEQLDSLGVDWDYEPFSIKFERPAQTSRYTPDFLIEVNGLLVETKGRFTSQERKKFKLIKQSHPDLDLRFVFSNPNTKIGKKSSTTYGMWCDRIGFPYAKELIPTKWLKENGNKKKN
tara:strand:- start:1 stop:411 length:411 start_codon:yes stop_codon:yes gene_type:complete